MSVSVAQLEATLVRLETEVGEALQQVNQIKRTLTPAERENERIERVRAENRRLRPYIDDALKGMIISDQELPSVEEIQQSIVAAGVKPDDNLFSRMLIEMREE